MKLASIRKYIAETHAYLDALYNPIIYIRSWLYGKLY